MNLNEKNLNRPDEEMKPDGNRSGREDTIRRGDRSPFTPTVIVAIVATLALGLIGGYFLLPGMISGDTNVVVDADHAGETIYYCPMHPHITSDQPGTCPICHMDLVPKNDPNALADHYDSAADLVHLTPRQRVVADVETIEADYRQLTADIEAPAQVEVNEATQKMVTAWFPGRIERLFVERTGDYIRKGEAIASIYSPELITAQKEYLLALDARNRNLLPSFEEAGESSHDQENSLIAASEERLKLLGMTDGQVGELRRSGKVARTITLYSTASGIVTRKGVTEGAYINEGTLMFEVVDLSSVWVVAEIYETQMGLVRPGTGISVTAPGLQGDRLNGRIDYIYPTVDPQTRTFRARATFPNSGLRLKPGMYLTASIITSAVDALAVPTTAVIRTGRRDIVYVEVDEHMFEAREVTVGMKSDGYYQITGGNLKRGDRVVVQGGYLLDSERQLTGE